jgi:hypothetical protein
MQVQQLGRTHRSNQVQPPKYLIVSSDISGEQRFASAVAKRLEQLGALTHGDRHASSASDALSSSNLQTKCGLRISSLTGRWTGLETKFTKHQAGPWSTNLGNCSPAVMCP